MKWSEMTEDDRRNSLHEARYYVDDYWKGRRTLVQIITASVLESGSDLPLRSPIQFSEQAVALADAIVAAQHAPVPRPDWLPEGFPDDHPEMFLHFLVKS